MSALGQKRTLIAQQNSGYSITLPVRASTERRIFRPSFLAVEPLVCGTQMIT
jgi:hypothetical protein